MGGIVIDKENGLRTDNHPHRMVESTESPGRRKTYLVAKLPAGDLWVHIAYSYDHSGYGGSEVDFLLESGEILTVKGPWQVHPNGNDHPVIASAFDEPLDFRAASRLHVMRGPVRWGPGLRGQDLIYSETKWSLGSIKTRVRRDHRGFFYAEETRSGVVYQSTDECIEIWKYLTPEKDFTFLEDWLRSVNASQDDWVSAYRAIFKGDVNVCV